MRTCERPIKKVTIARGIPHQDGVYPLAVGLPPSRLAGRGKFSEFQGVAAGAFGLHKGELWQFPRMAEFGGGVVFGEVQRRAAENPSGEAS